ncbi:hypothetical protein MTO96_008050 [Rhipicephalus appendiculatus]
MAPRRAPVYQVIDGLKYSNTYLPEYVRAIRNYMPQDDDLVLVSYLKCGNNWLEQIIQLILHRGESAENYAEFHRWCPYPEMTGMDYLNNMQPPRFFKTHFQYQQQLKNPKGQVHLPYPQSARCLRLILSLRPESFEVERGDYCDHLLSWYAHRHEENVFFLTFEHLKNDFRNTVLSLAGFMGEQYRRMLVEDEDVYRNVVEKSSVPYMSKMCYVDQSVIDKLTEKDKPYIEAVHRYMLATPGKMKGSNIVRKGAVGDWQSHFTPRHLELIREWIAKRNAAPVIRDLWGDMDLGGIF